jgi:hypothetical protein
MPSDMVSLWVHLLIPAKVLRPELLSWIKGQCTMPDCQLEAVK